MTSENIPRRRVLKTVGVGALISGTTSASAAAQSDPVFVYPVQTRSQAIDALEDHGGTVLFTYNNWEFIAGRVPTDNRSDLAADDRINFVEDDGRIFAIHHDDDHDGGPSDSDEEPSWGYYRIDADNANDTGSGMDVGILDTGIDTRHSDLEVHAGTNCTGRGSSYDDKNGHGTHCAGISSALDNDRGVRGVAPDANLRAVKVLNNRGSGRWSYLVCGIDYCMDNDVELISMSLGGNNMSTAAETAIEDAYAANHLLVAAAGNENNNLDGSCSEDNVLDPAAHTDVIAVSAMDPDDSLAGYSSVGDEIELMGPGTNIRSTYANDSYETLSGTSMACPHVTGVAALAWDGDNGSTRSSLHSTAKGVLKTCEEGHGLVKADDY